MVLHSIAFAFNDGYIGSCSWPSPSPCSPSFRILLLRSQHTDTHPYHSNACGKSGRGPLVIILGSMPPVISVASEELAVPASAIATGAFTSVRVGMGMGFGKMCILDAVDAG